ncbi:sigma-70 family RNA polymerase sigma factor [Streptomyces sp. SBT349]|uniref:sigma-70 family RNA polymerase sigma factor n=1 Tax=Streptomyces sp. SBT349 TaxID=1580539 RepID=UPI00066B6CAA|nr:sigma-70 family RNA polymerase sigma factor [Streptomyces sp. SBT349]
MTKDREFSQLTAAHRRELLAYCYRMSGSADDAEDLLQETLLRAWRAYDRFEHRASVRTWLYRIATNVCLSALERRARRPLPSGLGAPSGDPDEPPAPARPGVAWLQPLPDALLDAIAPADPANVVVARGSLRLALIAALQHLPPRQRAVLILRDVLRLRAAEVAELLGTTTPAVKSSLQRARAHLAEAAPAEDDLAEPTEPALRALLDRYQHAFETADVAALTRLLREDAELEMPPLPTWFTGRSPVAGFLAARVFGPPGTLRMLPTWANGQPAFAAYRWAAGERRYLPHAVQVLTVAATGVARIVTFLDHGPFDRFALPPALPPALPG